MHRFIEVPLPALWSFIGCVCLLCECTFIGAYKQLSIDPLDLLDVFCRGASCLERAMYSLYTLDRSVHEAIRLSFVCMVGLIMCDCNDNGESRRVQIMN